MSDSAVHDASTDLARERSRASADRTLLAWLRTALSLIGFGFTIAKIGDYIATKEGHEFLDPVRSTLVLGWSFLAIGVLALIGAIVQHRWVVKAIEAEEFTYITFRPLAGIVAILLIIVGLFGMLAVWL